ncbi:redoxin domain-containing protein [candidate division KSB1 bacterium]|nr:redoxin domain-containing protein [candidate division KSB1 bacterium]
MEWMMRYKIMMTGVILCIAMIGCENPKYDLRSELAHIDSLTVHYSALNMEPESLKTIRKEKASEVVIDLDPAMVDSGNRIPAAKLYLYAGLMDSAVTVLEAYKENCPDSAQLLLLFEAYYKTNRISDAERLYRQYLQNLNVSRGRIFRALFNGYRRISDYERALALAQEARSILPFRQLLPISLEEAELYYMLGRQKYAFNILSELSRHAGSVGERARITARRNLFNIMGKPAPPLQIQDWLSEDRVLLDDCKGSVVLLEFWAPHCTPCKQMFPLLSDLQARYSEKDLKVLAITRLYGYFHQPGIRESNLTPEEELNYIEKFKTQYKLSYPLGVAASIEGQINSLRYGVSVLPHTIIIDRSGIVRTYIIGADQEARQKLQNHIAELLAEPY